MFPGGKLQSYKSLVRGSLARHQLALGRGFAFNLGQPRDPMALQAAMQRRARQMRNGGLERVGNRRAAAGYAFGRRSRSPRLQRSGRLIGAPWVLSEDRKTDFRDFHSVMVFGLTPWRLASALRLS